MDICDLAWKYANYAMGDLGWKFDFELRKALNTWKGLLFVFLVFVR
jgi:hypothetical protein